jgi:coenzyme PQQ precursor peptide PqqA
MKIMSLESWRDDSRPRLRRATMRHGAARPPQALSGTCVIRQETDPMQWQTPTATDFRFGFEITMYVAAR